MKALALVSTSAWWVKGRRKIARQSGAADPAAAVYAAGDVWSAAEPVDLDRSGKLVFSHSLPSRWGLKYWYQVFNPYSDVSSSLLTSVLIALLSVGVVC